MSGDAGRVDGDGGSGKRGDVGTEGGKQAAEGHRAAQIISNPRAYRPTPGFATRMHAPHSTTA